ncbi:MAG: hybrid sensor histidine kinase/response regulator [Niabella sp.]
MRAIKVLYIDDEEHNLTAFKASFRRQYEIYTAISAKVAMELLESIHVNIIISDQRMPEMTGVEFFKSIKHKYPDPIRILLTGYTDIEALADAINHGDIYRYITKPWNDLDLHNSIKNAYDAYMSKVALREKVAELQATNDELNRFIYSISHELRAPLASALGIIDLVKQEDLYESTENYWELMDSCTSKLEYYIAKILQYYKNRRFDIVNEKVDFKELVNNLINLHTAANKCSDVFFSVNIDQQVPFYGDDFRIELILGNLISNAIKYQKPDEANKKVDIDINVQKDEVKIVISDNGLGILQDHLTKIFSQFFKSNNQTGTGLGLYIAKEALDKINGRIDVQSDTDKGTSFTIFIPNGFQKMK